MSTFHVGDHVRVMSVPPNLYRDDPISKEDAAFFEQCVGKVYQIEGFDEYDCLELWMTAEGKPLTKSEAFSPDGNSEEWHMIWTEPECVELA